MTFEPIAIIGQGCVLPGALTPQALWEAVASGRDLIGNAPTGRWGLSARHVMTEGSEQDRAWSDRGGYVSGFDAVFDPSGFALPAEEIKGLDPLFKWLLHAAREALGPLADGPLGRAGAVVGNLGFPSASMARYAERVWLGDALSDAAGLPKPSARERFMSGLPAHLMATALGLDGEAFALDAACASSLYAIKLACDRLQDRSADLMLAGAVNCADDLFIHVGFCALKAMSRTGQSRPFHKDADGLIPAEGAGIVVLKRLAEAERDGDTILGVIRGVGLSNDGRGRGLLVPAHEGQARAMRQAYELSGLSPSDISLVECHATGTPVGDGTEIRSMGEVFAGCSGVPIGSLKSNMGHLITAAGVGGLIKVLGAMKAGLRPPTLHAADEPNVEISGSPFRLLNKAEPWDSPSPRRASISAFGFGGNNAHLIVEAYEGPRAHPVSAPPTPCPIAIVAIGASVGAATTTEAFEAALFAPRDVHPAAAQSIELAVKGLRFPPNDLKQTLPQQLLMLDAAIQAMGQLKNPPPRDRTGVIIGMGTDPNVARYGARWRMAEWADEWGIDDPSWVEEARGRFVPGLQSAGVLGTMPNIPANRLNSQFDLGGPSLAVCAEELSGVRALQIAARALAHRELDAALVGAVDLSVEPVHQHALAALGLDRTPGDGAVALVLRRLDDARALGEEVIAVLDPLAATPRQMPAEALTSRFGHAHAASGLLQLTAAALACARGRWFDGEPWTDAHRAIHLDLDALEGQRAAITLRADGPPAPRAKHTNTDNTQGPRLRFPAHAEPIAMPPIPHQSTPTAPLTPLTPPQDQRQVMAPAPTLPPIHGHTQSTPPQPRMLASEPIASQPPQAQVMHPQVVSQPAMAGIYARVSAHHAQLSGLHQQFVSQQAQVHQQFLAMRHNTTGQFLNLYGTPPQSPPSVLVGLRADPPAGGGAQISTPLEVPAPPPQTPTSEADKPPTTARKAPLRQRGGQAPEASSRRARGGLPASQPTPPKPQQTPEPHGLTLDRKGLETHASGKISEIFGPLFEKQDGFVRQVRMPEPPLLLADRLIGLDAEPGSMGKGTIWTETDVCEDSWYLHDGRMPAGIMIESGQADLMLISYLGIDFLNQDTRIYRLLGCELTWHEHLPEPGETLVYDIHVDGHARQGDVRLFFFHYDCRINGKPRLTVRHGQAGFFTTEELDDSKGILWTAEEGERCDDPRMDPPPLLTQKRTWSRRELEAFAAGDVRGCFGPGFEPAMVHTRTPRISGGRMLFLDEVTHFEPGGGPWGRGYLRAVDAIAPDDWFFDGHFKNDPCMPGTLMFEGCLQTMAFYMAALGFTVDRDGWRFEPVPEETYKMQCRGQVTPTSRELIYELFIEEIIDGPEPTIYADLLCTVDGLGAFHCRRMGLRLVAGWPMDSRPDLKVSPKPGVQIAQLDGLTLDYNAMLACAWHLPSKAFGPQYEVFDGPRRVARLPGPPYHFMSRVTSIEGDPWAMTSGVEVEIAYDVPPEAWYFRDNGAGTMPFCVLLEAALQPCGWLASLVGSATSTEKDLSFRNLDGTGTLHVEVFPNSGTLRTRTRITNISRSAGMIIESFEVSCFLGDTLVYEMDTVFGFFPPEALAAQKGLAIPDNDRALFEARGEPMELRSRPARFFEGKARLPHPSLMVLDRITGRWPEGGAAGLGQYRGEKTVDPGEWFFKAHFYQDPVQPGSLGIEAMMQLLQFAMLDQNMDEGMSSPRFESLITGSPLTWKYRGQVRIHNETITSTLEITEKGEDDKGRYALARASLWVDGMRIYEAQGLGMRLIDEDRPAPHKTVTLDLARDAWLGDHRPTWTVPALPMMSMVDMMADAAQAEGRLVVGLRDVRVARWLTVADKRDVRVIVRGAVDVLDVRLEDDEGLIAQGKVLTQMSRVAGPAPLVSLDAPESPDPYASGALFHGPAFQALQSLKTGSVGASAVLGADPGPIPVGALNPRLMDAATHAIPHDSLHLWSDEVPEGMVAYPALITELDLHAPTPTEGLVRCEVRFDGFFGSKSFPAFRVQLIHKDQVWATFRLVEALFPKGSIGQADPLSRRAFLRDRQYVEGVGLSDIGNKGTSVLKKAAVDGSDWLPGTVEAIYGTRDPVEIARREHLGAKLGVHPGSAVGAAPLSVFSLDVADGDDEVVVRDVGDEAQDLSIIEDFWGGWFGTKHWPVADLYYGLIRRFVRRVVLPEPEAFEKIKGRSCLFLANHQVGVESLLFSILTSGLTGVPTVTLAKAEHRETWLGKLIAHCFSYPGIKDPEVIAFFDRADRSSLQRIIQDLAAQMAGPGKGVMVHVEGTRALSSRHRVEKMSGAFIDMALAIGAPIVPVRFVGGLPTEPLETRLEFPVGMGRQDYWLGGPLLPEDLASVPYGERKRIVIDAINGLGPDNSVEVPNPGDDAFAAATAAWAAERGVSHEHAALYHVLNEIAEPCEETRQLLDAARGGDVEGAWLTEMALRLIGTGS